MSMVSYPWYCLHQVKAMFMGGLVGDALALQGHYEYDAKKVSERRQPSATLLIRPHSQVSFS